MKITTIVLSYNRPRMLREALGSIRGAHEVIVVDDGSDFDVEELRNEFSFPRFKFVINNIKSNDRLAGSAMGFMINDAIDCSTGDAIAYLCDDDLFHPEWLYKVSDFMDKSPKYHFVKGYMKIFNDGTPIENSGVLIIENDYMQMTTGNFVHRKTCFKDEGIRWREDKLVGADMYFLGNANKVHDMLCVPTIPTVAIYRRIHEYNLFNIVDKTGVGIDHEKWDKVLNNKYLEQ